MWGEEGVEIFLGPCMLGKRKRKKLGESRLLMMEIAAKSVREGLKNVIRGNKV